MITDLGGAALRAEWNRLILVNWRFGPLEAIMRTRALIEISEGASTLDLLEFAAERLVGEAEKLKVKAEAKSFAPDQSETTQGRVQKFEARGRPIRS